MTFSADGNVKFEIEQCRSGCGHVSARSERKYVTSGVWVLTRATHHDYLKIKFGSIAEATSELGYTTPADVIGLYDDLQRKLYELSAEEVAV